MNACDLAVFVLVACAILGVFGLIALTAICGHLYEIHKEFKRMNDRTEPK